jgi:hypothetical protein
MLIPLQMYTRASASDYDDFQAKGWTTKELIPLMKKHETYQVRSAYSSKLLSGADDITSVHATIETYTASRAQSRSHSATTHIRSRKTSCALLSLRVSLPRTISKTWLPVTVLSIG